LPFGDSIPVLVADSNGFIHAVQRDEKILRYITVLSMPILLLFLVGRTGTVGNISLDMDVVVDGQGNIHLATFRALNTAELPAVFITAN
jgi:hypothetical protein